jgi:oligosaccharide repeat unit polymerase
MMVSWVASLFHYYVVSGMLFILLAIVLFVVYFRSTKNYLNSRGLYLFVWIFAIGLSAMKLHPLQVEWKKATWICLWGSIVFFLLGYNLARRLKIVIPRIKVKSVSEYYLIIIYSLGILSVFFLEVVAAGTIPLFSSNMSAYASFGLPYLHYITVSSVLIAPFSIVYLFFNRVSKIKLLILCAVNAVMLLIPVLIVSRQLLILGLLFCFFTIMELKGTNKIPFKTIGICMIGIFIGWMFLSNSRNQNDAYIKYVFHLDDKMSVSSYQMYMYLAFNIDNFNDAVNNIEGHSIILHSLNPLLTLTGTKGIISSLVTEQLPPRFLPVFTTYSFLLSPYEDLGVIGVILYCCGIGMLTGLIEKKVLEQKNVKTIVLHVVVNYCLIFSFFSSFLSNTSIWVYIVLIVLYDSICHTSSYKKT